MQRVKDFYLKELSAFQSTVKTGDAGGCCPQIQEWLNIWTAYNADFSLSLMIDGAYGPKTRDAVEYFQKFIGVDVTGAVDQKSWDALVAPLRKAFMFDIYPYQDTDIAKRVAYYAFQYEMWRPYEIEPNKGPWVRSFMDGHDGESHGLGVLVLLKPYWIPPTAAWAKNSQTISRKRTRSKRCARMHDKRHPQDKCRGLGKKYSKKRETSLSSCLPAASHTTYNL